MNILNVLGNVFPLIATTVVMLLLIIFSRLLNLSYLMKMLVGMFLLVGSILIYLLITAGYSSVSGYLPLEPLCAAAVIIWIGRCKGWKRGKVKGLEQG